MLKISGVLRAAVRRLLEHRPSEHNHPIRNVASHDQVRGFDTREYELYYWSGAPGPWY